MILTLLDNRSRASSSTFVLDRRSFQTGSELLELMERLHARKSASVFAPKPDSCVMAWQQPIYRTKHAEDSHLNWSHLRHFGYTYRSTCKLLNSKVTHISIHLSTGKVKLHHRAVVLMLKIIIDTMNDKHDQKAGGKIYKREIGLQIQPVHSITNLCFYGK